VLSEHQGSRWRHGDPARIPLEHKLEGPFDLLFPDATVVDLGKLVVFLANGLPHVGLGVLLEPPVEDQLFALDPTSSVWSKSTAGCRRNARDTTGRAKLWC
jgi:hypothetical protein